MKEKIIAVVVDTKLITLYREDASTIEVPQGDPRVRAILDQVVPVVNAGGIAEIDLSTTNSYEQFEKKSSGLVRFFRVAKKAVDHIFGGKEEGSVEPILPGQFGTLPNSNRTTASKETIDEILSQAKPSNTHNFEDNRADSTTNDDTIIAVVSTPEGDKVIPEAEKLRNHITYSAGKGSTKGMEAFFARISNVMDIRAHSVQDLLRFLENADLPIADDGCIVAYKVLHRHSHDSNTYVDCHTRKVPQRIGSKVQVHESLVDRNRRNECSNGLHVARRGYLNGFSGDVCTLIKVAPEDVVTVPHGDANKVRVCAYHILFELDQDSYSKLKANRPMTDNPKAAQLVSRAISGDHPGIREIVEIRGQLGTDVKVTRVGGQNQKAEVENHAAFDDAKNSPMSVDPKELSKKAAQERQETPAKPVEPSPAPVAAAPEPAAPEVAPEAVSAKPSTESVMDTVNKITGKPTRELLWQKVQKLWHTIMHDLNRDEVVKAANEIKAIKKTAKVNWYKLGMTDDQAIQLNALINDGIAVPESMLELEEATASDVKDIQQAVDVLAAEDNNSEDLPEPPTKKLGTVQAEARRLFDEKKFDELFTFKRSKKKSWEALGFTSKEADTIMSSKGA